jgi:protein involved in polysaccharide export with SLBB domain
MNRALLSPVWASILLVLCAHSLTFAQFDQSTFLSATSTQQTTSNYYFAKPNEITIVVNVLGFVQKPGRYEVSKNVDLVNLLSLAGGATPDGTLGDVKITRIIDTEGKIRMKEFSLDLNDIARVNRAELILFPGDVIQVGRSSWSGFRDVFGVLVGTAVIVTAVATVIYAVNSTN